MSVHNDLAQRIGFIGRLMRICGNVLEQTEHGRNAIGVDPVLGLFQADQSGCLRIQFKNGQGQEPKRPVRECAGGQFRAVSALHHERQKFTFLVTIDPETANTADELAQAIGQLAVDARRGIGRCQPVQIGREMQPVALEVSRGCKFTLCSSLCLDCGHRFVEHASVISQEACLSLDVLGAASGSAQTSALLGWPEALLPDVPAELLEASPVTVQSALTPFTL